MRFCTSYTKLVTGLCISAFLIGGLVVPTRTQAQGLPVYDNAAVVLLGTIASIEAANSPVTATESALDVVVNTLGEIGVWAQEALEYLFYINTYVLEPLAFIQSGNAVKGLTAGALSFVTGQTNGTGQKQFATNFLGQLQGVGTNQALAFTAQLQKNLDSPYASVISASLRRNYLEGSSLQGFFSANRSTLGDFTNGNPTAFLAGNWSQGGVRAWLALTTQERNNPFLLYQNARGQIGSQITQAQQSQKEQLSWGQGFMSWCGSTEAPPEDFESCDYNGTLGYWENGQCNDNTLPGQEPEKLPVSPGSPCMDRSGKPGEMKTPGSVIKGHLEKSLNLNAEKIATIGNAATQITSLIGGIMQTVQLAQQVIGGSDSNGGLAGAASSIAGQPSILSLYQDTSEYGGVNQCSVNRVLYENLLTSENSSQGSGNDTETRAAEYIAAWDVIGAAARAASTTVTQLRDICTTNAAVAGVPSAFVTTATNIANDAARVLGSSTEEGTILFYMNKAAEAPNVVANAAEDRAEIMAQLQSTDAAVCSLVTSRINELRSTPPTAQDLANAQRDAKTLGGAEASPGGSLLVSPFKGSIVDRMNLLAANATTLKPLCAVPVDGVTPTGPTCFISGTLQDESKPSTWLPYGGGLVPLTWSTDAVGTLSVVGVNSAGYQTDVTGGEVDTGQIRAKTVPVTLTTTFTMTVKGLNGESTCETTVFVNTVP